MTFHCKWESGEPPTCTSKDRVSLYLGTGDDNAQNIRHRVTYRRKYNRHQSMFLVFIFFFFSNWKSLDKQQQQPPRPSPHRNGNSKWHHFQLHIRCDWMWKENWIFLLFSLRFAYVCLTQTCDTKRKSIQTLDSILFKFNCELTEEHMLNWEHIRSLIGSVCVHSAESFKNRFLISFQWMQTSCDTAAVGSITIKLKWKSSSNGAERNALMQLQSIRTWIIST